MATSCVSHISLEINCGFARTAIRELTPKNEQVDKQQRACMFKELYDGCSGFGFRAGYFEESKNGSLFSRGCTKILQAFNKRWHPKEAKKQYEDSFSLANWKALSTDKKKQHRLSKCTACYKQFHDLQMTFPQQPHYTESILSVNTNGLSALGKKQATRQALAEINTSFSTVFDTDFKELLVKHDRELQKKPSAAEKKKERRSIYRKVRDQENKSLVRSAAVSVLTEDESQRAYQRKRKRQYFETPPPPKRQKTKSHSPDFSNVTWNKEEVLHDLQNHPQAPPPINWQQFARDHNITGRNAGQVVKEFAKHSEIDTAKLDGKTTDTPRSRSHKRKLMGKEISVPSTPTPETIRNEWKQMIQSGEISIGVSCVPYQMDKYITNNGQLEHVEVVVLGRKFPLLSLRKTFLSDHKPYMRLNTDEEINGMSCDTLKTITSHYSDKIDIPTNELRNNIKQVQRSRSFTLWHDHGTILGLGCLLVTAHIAYDPAVFYTQSEYEEIHGKSPSIQSLVERPKLYIMAAGSSSIEDQVSIIQDRIDCLQELSINLTASNGVVIHDKMMFFIGDHPAQQFERGTQVGGKFKCGGCGVKDTLFGDFAHTLQHPWRSIHDLQSIATAGKFGKSAGNPKPFDKLKVAQIKEELHARGEYDNNKKKEILQCQLDNILCGIQRVPTMLLLNPKQNLFQLNLQDYTIIDCEPLHDIKGHFSNLFSELPYLFKGDDRTTCEQVIAANKGSTMTGAKCRVCMIELFLHLRHRPVSSEILLLVETAVRISELLYMHDSDRNTRNILQLYNCVWLHHELCSKLITTFHSGMSYNKLFGNYLHALVAHAPQQLEIISLRSVNTENQERIFEQARRSATADILAMCCPL